MTHAERIAGNIVRAQCLDLGLEQVEVVGQGLVQAQLQDRWYLFSWDWDHQQVRLEATYSVSEPWLLVG